ncbi:cell division protein Fic [Lentzea sp. NBRC 105346]|uniref:Fic family protein n=1 Tax=Lentzea sp. NBRC 105346 TaxID=3032205 RepID=UPI0024A269F7|nr:Fic family protein [Lentzea sp. NBRC 105346]GLZ34343.1 cell division protein Fic [Lentzea sp. NBRC 105346]
MSDVNGDRAGRFVRQPQGYRAFIPADLPPQPPIIFDADLVNLLGAATTALGRLDGLARMLPNPDLFVAMYVRREAVLSSQIEGTQSTLDDVLTYEINPDADHLPGDVEEVVNYVDAMKYGLTRLESFPLCLRLLREIHGMLLRNTRGGEKMPGEFRVTQNWIGAPGPRGLDDATFVPPPPHEMGQALDNFERFLHHSEPLHPLIACGIAHAQFETIHPFLDGNGRVGRLLVTFLLCHAGVVRQPLLYLSHYLKLHRAEYYDRLTAVRRSGDWEGWLRFFLQGVAFVAAEAEETAGRIVELREHVRKEVSDAGMPASTFTLIDKLFYQPLINVNIAAESLGSSFVTANNMINRLCELGVLVEVTGGKRNRRFRFDRYLALFEYSGEFVDPSEAEQTQN